MSEPSPTVSASAPASSYEPSDSSISTSSIKAAVEGRARRSSSFSSIRAASGTPDLSNLPKIGKIGVCAMDVKARSKPCRHILNRLLDTGEFETVVFGDKVILDEPIENWPTCDFLISFFSSGFPLEKAISYVKLRKPFMVNDLILQKVLWDRRIVLDLLDSAGVQTPPRLICTRDGGAKADPDLAKKLAEHNVILTPQPKSECHMVDEDTVMVDGKTMTKPFVEKPVDGEDHNIYVYYPKSAGGGGRRLFRKVGNKSSEFDQDLCEVRMDGSYIYEKFMDTENKEDVKAYTVGAHYCHAETRKSPVVDGIVRRNTYGKELRFVTKLTDEEIKFASKVSQTFEQTICGFDLLRAQGESYVIDVNGFSFVKDNHEYYDNCARILRQIFLQAKQQRNKDRAITNTAPQPEKHQSWVLKGQAIVIRHADRTPKQKIKVSFKHPLFIDLLKGHKEEVLYREKDRLMEVLETTRRATKEATDEDPQKMANLIIALEKKMDFPGTKVQIKPTINKSTGEVEKVQLVAKWGGEPTHSARYQAQDMGDQMRQDLMIVNKNLLKNVKCLSSSERRVIASAKIWAAAFLGVEEVSDDFIVVRKGLLDDSNAAKDLMDKVKKELKPLLRKGTPPPPHFTWPDKIPEPFIVLQRVVELMKYHHKVMERNFNNHTPEEVEAFQTRWCCQETPFLFRERWDKLFSEFTSPDKVDPSRISELYDAMKFDALHNRQFLERIFKPDESVEIAPPSCHIPNVSAPELSSLGKTPLVKPTDDDAAKSSSNGKSPQQTFYGPQYVHLRELYRLAKILFDFICPQEYGIEDKEKLDIGLLTCLPLLKEILSELNEMKQAETGGVIAYFTKESHIYTLLNIIYESGINTRIARNVIPELDYLTQIVFELYESVEADEYGEKKYSIRLSISPGCNTQSPLDVQLDSKHCISCIPRVGLTRHLDLDLVIGKLQTRFNRVSMPSKFIPVNIS
ncbi:Inositol hexakisphosphate and diphosphoinositol-pentakisphosphate kinase [Yarrowia sp. C11]|nr:Inositol hexakisphosphate and diphosphoinositol-pentakisphosphate kinase [Yarrowia sp. E02]KAG5372786.1 Inositol hexakisphosphate and diphosphoinositol-pentakisphosphate kinase [Yarrowia sp. C11]